MSSLRVGIVAHWPEVARVVWVMLQAIGHRPVDSPVDDQPPPDVVVRDAGCRVPDRWAACPVVVMCGGAAEEVTPPHATLVKPFTPGQLDTAVRHAVGTTR